MFDTKSIESNIELTQYRLGLLIAVIIYAPFGYITEKFINNGFDTFLIRLPVDLLCLITLILSFKIEFLKKNLRFFFIFCTMAIEWQYFDFFAKSNQHFFYTIGITLTPVLIFLLLYRIQDIIFAYIYFIFISLLNLMGTNLLYFITYSTMLVLVILVYYVTIRNRNFFLRSLQDLIIKIESKNKSLISIGELAAQVAHDIRSPVAALQAVSETLDNIEPKKKQLIEKSAVRIGQIADYLVSEYRTSVTSDIAAKTELRAQYLNEVIQDIIDEKRILLKNNSLIKFDEAEQIKVPDYLNLVEFRRVLSNLFNNAIEAFDKNENIITIKLTHSNNVINLTITDNGKGIPEEYISKVFEKGVKFSKTSGTGLGLSHALNYLTQINGKINLSSQKDKGTIVSIQLIP